MGGIEFEAYDEILKKIHGTGPLPAFDQKLYEKIASEQNLFILPGVTPGTGQFPESTARVIEKGSTFDFEEIRSREKYPSFFMDKAIAYAVLNLSLAVQTKISLDRSDMRNGMPLYTEGGFSQNKGYNLLLSGFYPDSNIYLTNLNEATAYGAALIGKAAKENKHPTELSGFLNIEKKPVGKLSIRDLDQYLKAYLDRI
jgi:hypothetical protein